MTMAEEQMYVSSPPSTINVLAKRMFLVENIVKTRTASSTKRRITLETHSQAHSIDLLYYSVLLCKLKYLQILSEFEL